MYYTLMVLHSIVRWLVLVSMVYAIYRAARGYLQQQLFTNTDDRIRHWTATFAHIQLMLGIVLYTKSPLVKQAFTTSAPDGALMSQPFFFGVLHALLMLISIVIATIGSALAKRRATDKDKFRTMLLWYSASLLVLLVAIPWPFSPLAQRPYIRSL